ncbi:integrase domain-containing protein [Comamonas sp. w2-DMI]|uniref:site-specific integrase n=1 Tax=Comamonas sp. w2-DMI TaxID=3126391 RepID=UPI0032E3BFAF
MPSSSTKANSKTTRYNARKSADSATQIRLDPRGILDHAIQEHKGDVHKQVSYFYKHYPVPAAQGRARVVSAKTLTKYVLATHMLIDALKAKGVKLHGVNDLTSRHLLTVMRHWEAEGMASSSLATYFSCLKRFFGWLRVKLPYESVHETLVDPNRGKRAMSATTSLAWSAKGVDFQSELVKIHELDPLVALQAEMVAAFGLRVMEACAMRPIECDRGNHLAITYGAKGGRGRQVPITSQYQREVLDKAKQYAGKHNGFLRTNRFTQKQAYRRFYYILEKAGVNKAEAGVSAHGLRHEYANDIYTQVTGEASPVNHGKRVSKEQDRKARSQVTEALGHSRLAITSNYLGSHVMMERANQKRLARMHSTLTMEGAALHLHHREIQRAARQEEPGVELRLFVTGPAADGKDIVGVPIVLACGLYQPGGLPAQRQPTEEQRQKLASVCQEMLGLWCVGQLNESVPSNVSRVELMFHDD